MKNALQEIRNSISDPEELVTALAAAITDWRIRGETVHVRGQKATLYIRASPSSGKQTWDVTVSFDQDGGGRFTSAADLEVVQLLAAVILSDQDHPAARGARIKAKALASRGDALAGKQFEELTAKKWIIEAIEARVFTHEDLGLTIAKISSWKRELALRQARLMIEDLQRGGSQKEGLAIITEIMSENGIRPEEVGMTTESLARLATSSDT